MELINANLLIIFPQVLIGMKRTFSKVRYIEEVA